jgi:hypothetical protein
MENKKKDRHKDDTATYPNHSTKNTGKKARCRQYYYFYPGQFLPSSFEAKPVICQELTPHSNADHQAVQVEIAYQPHPLNPPLLEKERGRKKKEGHCPS